ncbi:MAG: EVE domain-containing protein [Gammaproteobacteria bacterium]|nr:EVE domain-containing protein [Gammaproteobacteria bacterium]
MNYWLMKSEPDEFSIDDLKTFKKKGAHWDGVRNYQARNFMRDDMKKGDLVLFYHSNTKVPGVVGIAEVVKEAYPDHTAFDPEDKHYDPKSDPDNPRWMMVNVAFRERFDETVSLQELRDNPVLEEMQILRRGNRLSITPVTRKEWNAILKMAGSKMR